MPPRMAPVRARAEAVGAPRGDGPPPGEAHADHQARGTARDAAQVHHGVAPAPSPHRGDAPAAERGADAAYSRAPRDPRLDEQPAPALAPRRPSGRLALRPHALVHAQHVEPARAVAPPDLAPFGHERP